MYHCVQLARDNSSMAKGSYSIVVLLCAASMDMMVVWLRFVLDSALCYDCVVIV